MIVKFNPSGTHIHKGFLKVRFDLYPDAGSKTFPLHYVDKLDRPPTQEEINNPALLALIPTHKELNPCLCHFLIINTNTSLSDMGAQVAVAFDPDILSRLDDALSVFNPTEVSRIMKPKAGTGTMAKGNLTKIVNDTNTKFSGLEVSL